jgi:hypothetical protein
MTRRILLEPQDTVKVDGKDYKVCDHMFEGDTKVTILVKGKGPVTIGKEILDESVE